MSGKSPSLDKSSVSHTAPLSEEVRHLNQIQLAHRWQLSPRTLERWRSKGIGPKWFKVGSRVLYRIEDVVQHEQSTAKDEPEPPK